MTRLNPRQLLASFSKVIDNGRVRNSAGTGGRSMQAEAAMPARATRRNVTHEVKQRLLNVVVSRGERAVQQSRENTRREVGKLLRMLSSPSKNARSDFLDAKELISGLTATMQPMTSRGNAYEEEFRLGVQTNLKDTSTDDIVKLHDALAKPRNPVLSLDPNHFVLRHFRDIQGTMAKELERRVFADSALPRMLETGMSGAIEPQELYPSMMAAAGRILSACRHPWQDATAQRDLVMATFAHLLEAGTITDAQVDWFVAVLPSAEVKAMASHMATGFDVPTGAQEIARIAQNHLMQRRKHWGESFNAAMIQVCRPADPYLSPQRHAQAVITAADYFEEYTGACSPGLPANPDLDQLVKNNASALKAHLESLLQPLNRPFGTLSGAQLRKIDSVLEKLGSSETPEVTPPAAEAAGQRPEPAKTQARRVLHKGANPRLLKPLPRDNLGAAVPATPKTAEAPPKPAAPRRVLQPGRDFNPRLLAKPPKKGPGAT